MSEKDNVDYKTLYYFLFNKITWLSERIIETADNSDQSARAFVLQLHFLQLQAEEKYLEMTEVA